MSTAVYGGSFDPITFGHIKIIEKASRLFEKIYVVVASNPGKKYSYFDLKERVELIQKCLMQSRCILSLKVEVDILPEHEFLVNYAQRKRAVALIRGLRDDIDFNVEQKIGETNQRICPYVETVYIMPPANLAVVSSSWAKSLVGYRGWKKALDGCIPKDVIKELELKWLKKEIESIFLEAQKQTVIVFGGSLGRRDKHDPFFNFDVIWHYLVRAYQSRAYHNLSHISDMLINFSAIVTDSFAKESKRHPLSKLEELIAKLAIIFHDFEKTELASANAPIEQKILCFRSKYSEDLFKRIIMATKHDENAPVAWVDSIVADLDLLILAEGGQDYAKAIREEYVGKQCDEATFVAGRIKFLEGMILKKHIYHTEYFRFNFDFLAKAQMGDELVELRKDLPEDYKWLDEV